MACTLCRLPFWPHPHASRNSFPPSGLVSEEDKVYLTSVFAVAERLPLHILQGSLVEVTSLSCIIPGIPLPVLLKWETDDCIVPLFHTACLNILRHVFGLHEPIPEHIAGLCSVSHVLGKPIRGETHGPNSSVVAPGQWLDMNYAKTAHDPLDVDAFYFKSMHDGEWKFDWSSFAQHDHAWALTRPNTFPHFQRALLAQIPSPAAEQPKDHLTTLPLDVLDIILPCLDIESFCHLMSTCRTFRRHALTSFARERVLALNYALPTPREYMAALSANPNSMLLNPADPLKDGDWMRYLVEVLNSDGMRARRRIWELAAQAHDIYLEKIVDSEWEDKVVFYGNEGTMLETRKNAQERQLEDSLNTVLQARGGGVPLWW